MFLSLKTVIACVIVISPECKNGRIVQHLCVSRSQPGIQNSVNFAGRSAEIGTPSNLKENAHIVCHDAQHLNVRIHLYGQK